MSFFKPKKSDEAAIGTPAYELQVVEVIYNDKEASRTDIYGPTFDSARTARLLRKMDLNIVPFLALLYLWVFLPLHPNLYLHRFEAFLSSIELTSEMLAL